MNRDKSASLRLALVKFHPGDSVSVGWVDSTGNRHNQDVKLIVDRLKQTGKTEYL